MAKHAIVTGGASGIGLQLALQLAARGVVVTLADLGEDRVEAAVARVRAVNESARGEVMDVTDRDRVREVVERTARDGGGLDYLFNNAGIGIAGELQDMTIEDWRRVTEVNFFGVLNGVDAAYPLMIKQGFGHIVNVGSVAGLVPLPGEAVYVAGKHAVTGLTQTLRAEAAAYGVRVSLVCPGVIKTPIYDTSPVVGFTKEKVLSLWPEGISPEDCARKILRGVDRNEGFIVVTPVAHVLWRFHRLSSGLFLRAAGLYMKQLRATRGS